MPEGPEIKRAADELRAAINGCEVTDIFFAFDHLKKFRKRLLGAKISDIRSRSKAMLIQFDNDLTIYSHNQLYGRWAILATGKYPESTRSLRLAIHTRKNMALLYSASEIEVIKTSETGQHSYLKKLGPELLDNDIKPETIISRFNEPPFQHRQLMSLLQDQTFISGMGNYLCCEALYISHIHPGTHLAKLNKTQKEKLAKNCLKLTRQSYKTGGITNLLSRAEKLRKQGLAFEDYRFWVYRRDNCPCYHCGTDIIKGRYGGKTAYICPVCQTEKS